TAQKVGPDGGYLENNYIVSFIGSAPADDPEIVVYVAIDNPKDTVQFGGPVVGPIGGNIIGDSLRALGDEERTDGLEKDYVWTEQPKIKVPDLLGLDKQELINDMTDLSIESSGTGDTIIDQSPKPGVKLEQGEKIRIYLSDEKHRD